MIVKKTWERIAYARLIPADRFSKERYRDVYTGWFLLGIIPLFVIRDRRKA